GRRHDIRRHQRTPKGVGTRAVAVLRRRRMLVAVAPSRPIARSDLIRALPGLAALPPVTVTRGRVGTTPTVILRGPLPRVAPLIQARAGRVGSTAAVRVALARRARSPTAVLGRRRDVRRHQRTPKPIGSRAIAMVI